MENKDLCLVGELCENKDGIVYHSGTMARMDYEEILKIFSKIKDKSKTKEEFFQGMFELQMNDVKIMVNKPDAFVRVYLQEKGDDWED